MNITTVTIEFRESDSATLHRLSLDVVLGRADGRNRVVVNGHMVLVGGVWSKANDTQRGVAAFHYAALSELAVVAAANDLCDVQVTL